MTYYRTIPCIRAFCKGITCGANGVYIVGAEDAALIGWVLDLALRPRLAAFVAGVWQMTNPLANLAGLDEMFAQRLPMQEASLGMSSKVRNHA
jgi:hypothetical protein